MTALTPRARANADQRAAADPAVSAFVAASAGSGKTKLLTDRLLRLMLGGAAPERILCLTFTKAAAAEMALRLQRRLGEWVSLSDAALDARLQALDVTPAPAIRATARALFARVLDLPGGMRISTIHGFCQSLLRRFPLEAGISPHFRLIEDNDQEDALAEAGEDMLAAADPPSEAALTLLAGLVSAADFHDLVRNLLAERPRLEAVAGRDPAALAGMASARSSASSAESASPTQRPSLACRRSAISAAAALVKVRQRIRPGSAPPSISRSSRSVSSLVLPDPAEAATKAETAGSAASR